MSGRHQPENGADSPQEHPWKGPEYAQALKQTAETATTSGDRLSSAGVAPDGVASQTVSDSSIPATTIPRSGTTDNEPATGLDPRDSTTVWQIARNIVDEFPAIPKDIRATVASEIAGALGHERLAAERASGGLTGPQREVLMMAAAEVLAGEGEGWTARQRATLERAVARLASDLRPQADPNE